jgi:hypothetical protein
MPAEPAPRPWRRFLRFSVRGLLVLVMVIGVGLGWLVRNAQIQREAVAAIRRAGGAALYDEEMRGPTQAHSRPAAWVDVIRTRIDRNYFSNVVSVHWWGGEGLSTDDQVVVHISHLRRVATLNLSGRAVTDSRFARLNNLSNVETLMLQHTAITDSGLASLEGMKDLRFLLISGPTLTDKGLEHLRGLDSITTLSLQDSRISDAGMVHLRKLTKLSVLNLCGTQVTEAGTKELKQALPSLTILR